MDALYPGTFAFSKVKWNAKHEYEFVENYKILQNAFDKNGVKRYIEVNKLVKAKYQDNLEFCQWLKAYFEKNYNGEFYDAVARRKGQDLFYIAGGGKVAPISKAGYQPPKPAAKSSTGSSGYGPAKSTASSSISGGARPAAGVPQAKVAEYESQIQELKLQNDTLDKERDFYFSKLREIEVLLQHRTVEGEEPSILGQDILKILYASEDEKVAVSADGVLTITAPDGTV